jgi:glycosyltransferase involved in cell wall biosynthesis
LLPDLRAVILGDGEQRAAVRAEIERLGLSEVIDLPGFVNEDVLDGYLRSAACLVNPSRREGYGLVVVEACAVGTPVVLVAALDNAAVELIDEGVNGFVAASTAPEVLGAALVRAVEGGRALRESARAWFETASVERTAAAAAAGILERLASPR